MAQLDQSDLLARVFLFELTFLAYFWPGMTVNIGNIKFHIAQLARDGKLDYFLNSVSTRV